MKWCALALTIFVLLTPADDALAAATPDSDDGGLAAANNDFVSVPGAEYTAPPRLPAAAPVGWPASAVRTGSRSGLEAESSLPGPSAHARLYALMSLQR